MPYCQNCGYEYTDQASFCRQCGTATATIRGQATPSRNPGPAPGPRPANPAGTQQAQEAGVNWTCDREQCRHTMIEEPKKGSQIGERKFTSVVFLILGIGISLTIIGALLGIPMIIAALATLSRRHCPACRRGNMLNVHTDSRGRALLARRTYDRRP